MYNIKYNCAIFIFESDTLLVNVCFEMHFLKDAHCKTLIRNISDTCISDPSDVPAGCCR